MATIFHLPMKIENLCPVGRFVYTSLSNHHSDFTTHSQSVYGGTFLTDFDADLIAGEAIVRSSFFISEIKLERIHFKESYANLRPLLNPFEDHVDLAAAGLKVLPKDFGIHQLRTQISKKNPEGILDALKLMNKNIADPTNLAALTAVDFKIATQTLFTTAETTIAAAINNINTMVNTKENAVQNNAAVFQPIWDKVTKVCRTGKRLFKFSDKELTREFTIEVLKNRVRRAVHKTIAQEQGSTSEECLIPFGPAQFVTAPFLVIKNTKYLISGTGDTAFKAFLSKTQTATEVPEDFTLIEPDGEEILDSIDHPDCLYLILVNVDPKKSGEASVSIVE